VWWFLKWYRHYGDSGFTKHATLVLVADSTVAAPSHRLVHSIPDRELELRQRTSITQRVWRE
jgi:hypothetical protein